LNAAGGRLASAIVTGAAKGIAGGAKSVVNAAIGMAKGAITGAMDALDADSPSKEFEKVGKYAVQGFAKGLTGNRDQITAAYNLMRDLLKTARANAKEDIKASEERLIKLNKHRSKNKKAIKEEEKDLKQARKEYVRAGEAYDELTKKRDDDRDRLRTMADKNDKLTESIRTQTEALKQAKQVRDDYARSIREQYDDMPDLIQKTDTTEATTVKSYADDLRRSISDVHTFNSAITRLRDMGLNDTMYMELLAKGPDALPFLQQILDGGTNSVKELNKLSSDLANEAKKLGNTASQELYQAGVDAAQGLLDGLVKDQQKLEAAMTKLAKALAAAIKKELGIKSPSLVFKDIGGNVTKGLAEGMTAYSSTVEKAAEGVGQDAILALTKTISGMSDLIQGDLDLAPTITPVLDLTDVKRQAASLGSLLGASPVSVSGTYSGAQAASVGYDANKAAGAMDSKVEIIDQRVSFTQNNTSPKALSPAEIYRQTKNQLSVAKGAVR
jgi:hypothetical protein